MPRDAQEPTTDADGRERHPAFGMVRAGRVQGGASSLFDSEIRHQHYVTFRVHRATRKRDLHRDWIMEDLAPIVEIAFTEAQWAQMVSSLNSSGTSCTIQYVHGEATPGIPFAPRLAVSHQETKDAAHRIYADALAALEAHKEAKGVRAQRETLNRLESTLRNAAVNVEFAAKSLTEHSETVTERARADVEAMIDARARQLGIDPHVMTVNLERTSELTQ